MIIIIIITNVIIARIWVSTPRVRIVNSMCFSFIIYIECDGLTVGSTPAWARSLTRARIRNVKKQFKNVLCASYNERFVLGLNQMVKHVSFSIRFLLAATATRWRWCDANGVSSSLFSFILFLLFAFHNWQSTKRFYATQTRTHTQNWILNIHTKTAIIWWSRWITTNGENEETRTK